jgi:eukaryotic-like serine/threonine-protein kinase
MNTDLNLLFAVLAMQSGLISSDQFIDACMLWTARKGTPLADLLVGHGWIKSGDVSHIQYLIERKLERHGGDPKLSLAALDNDIKRQLASIDDEEIQRSLGHVPDSTVLPSAAVTVDVPEKTERYSLMSLHASGGGGRVWLAHDTHLDRDVAFKELRPEAAGDGALWTRFQREARVTGQLEHPGIVPVYDYGKQSANQPFYTMRFVKGRTLTEAAREYHAHRASGRANSMELIPLLSAFTTVCNTIAYAHSRGVIHRDLKGENVILGDFGEVVVLDWGLAKVIGESDPVDRGEHERSHQIGRVELTIQGQTVGTPGYMAPEQAAGRPDLIDRRTDSYGLGAILYEVLTGQPPFTGSDTKEVLRKVRQEDPHPPSRMHPEVPETLEKICLKAIAKNPADRYEHAVDLAHEVQLWQDLQRRKAERELDLLFNLSLDLFCVGGYDGYFKRLNPAWERTLGYSIAELLARPWLDFVHPDDREATVAQGESIIIGGRPAISFRNRYRHRDGSYRWLSWMSTPFPEDQLIYASARDITEQRLSEERLRESELRYRSVVASLDEGIVLLDGDGTFVGCNSSAERILGLSADEIVGRTNVDPRWVTISEDGSPFPQQNYPVTVTLRTGQPCSNVVMGVYKPDGTLNWISINSQPLIRADAKTVYGVLASFTDITELKHFKEQLQALKQEKSASQLT